jgi:NADH:ubiquinone oxidoreductase subunit E
MKELNVCIGSACHLRGAYNIIQTFQQLMEEKTLHDKLDLKATFCMRECHNVGVSVTCGGQKFRISPDGAREFFAENVEKTLGEG